MIQKFNEIIGELQEQGKKYPKMWTNDVIKIITHLRDVVSNPKEPEAVHGNEAKKEVFTCDCGLDHYSCDCLEYMQCEECKSTLRRK